MLHSHGQTRYITLRKKREDFSRILSSSLAIRRRDDAADLAESYIRKQLMGRSEQPMPGQETSET